MKIEGNSIEQQLAELLEKKVLDRGKLENNMKQACLIVEASAKKKVPVDRGDLRRSIESTIESHQNLIEGIVYTNLEYAPYVELGTGLFAANGDGRTDVPWVYQDDNGEWHSTIGQHPQPFLIPSLYENEINIKKKLMEGI